MVTEIVTLTAAHGDPSKSTTRQLRLASDTGTFTVQQPNRSGSTDFVVARTAR